MKLIHKSTAQQWYLSEIFDLTSLLLRTHHRDLKGPVVHRSGAFIVQGQASPHAPLST